MWRSWGLIILLTIGMLPLTAGGAPADCAIAEGAGIGGVRLGMAAATALSVTGPPEGQQTVGSQVVYSLRAPWWWMVTDYGIVQRIGTRAAECRTSRGVGPGSTLAVVRDAYAGAPLVSILVTMQDGDLLSYPLVGVAFRLRRDQVEAVEVFRAERLTAAPAPAATPVPGPASPQQASPGPAGPTPTPTTAPGSWSVRSTSVRVDESGFVITGTVENRSRTQGAYAEVRVFNPAGRLVAQGDAPLQPNPVPGGGSGTFEVRLAIDDVVRRYLVTVRPLGSISVTLAEQTGEVKDLQQFASIVAKQVQATAQTISNPPTRDDFIVVVTNGSPLTVASVTVIAEITATCRIPFPIPRTIQELRSGSVVVQQLRPGTSARVALPISAGACLEFATWSAQFRIGEVRVGD